MKPLTPYPKVWGGFNAVGERKMHALESVDAPFLTAMGPDGSMTMKKGLFREVYISPGKADGFYCLGQIQPQLDYTQPTYVSGSSNGIAFGNRGRFFSSVSFIAPALVPLGGGNGYVLHQDQVAGRVQDEFTERFYRTRDGRTFQYWFGFLASNPPQPQYGNRISGTQIAASYCRGPITGAWGWTIGSTYLHITLDVPQPAGHLDNYYGAWTPSYSLTEGDTWYASSGMLGVPAMRMGIPIGGRATPYHLVLCTPFYVTPGSGSGVSTPFITYSADNGKTWTLANYAAFMTNIIDPIPPTNSDVAFDQNATLVAESFSVIPRDLTSCYITCMSVKAALPFNPRYIGTLDLATGAISDVHQMAQPFDAGNYFVWMSQVFSNGWYVNMYADQFHPTNPAVIWRTKDFVSWETYTTGFNAQKVGFLTEFDPHTIYVTYYVAPDIKLFQSKDAGVTWTMKSTVRSNVPVDPDTVIGLQRFGLMTILRKNGVPANVALGQPWVCDARLTP